MMRTASCQCRGFRIVVETEPDLVAICHCQISSTGVPLTCNAYFPKSKVLLEGEHKIYTRDCSEGRKLHNYFCPTCGSTVGWTFDLRPNLFGVVLGASTTAISRLPFCQPGKKRCTVGRRSQRTFSISHAVAWLQTQADASDYSGYAVSAERRQIGAINFSNLVLIFEDQLPGGR